MKILVACEYSGVVRDAFIAKGHDAISCDLLDTESPGPHYKGNVIDILNDGWDLMVAHPPCTYLTTTGNKWMKPEFSERFPNRKEQRASAIDLFLTLARAPIVKIAIENPKGIMSSVYKKPTQYIHPYYFGDPESKMTGLWLKNLPVLIPTNMVEPTWFICRNGKREPNWHMKTMKISLSGGARGKARSKTFKSIAQAMADQWG